jgi:AraC-like DNA-binding protein
MSATDTTDMAGNEQVGPWSEPAAMSMDEAKFAPAKIAGLVDLLAEAGVAPEAVLADTGLTVPDLRQAVPTSPQQFLIAARNAVRLYGQRDLGVRLGRRLHVTSYGMFGYALLCSETLAHLHATAFKYHRLANGLLQFRLVEGDGTVTWELPIRELVLVPGLDEELYRFLLDLQFSVMVTMWKEVMGSWCVPARVSYAGPQPPHAAALAEALECPILFDQPRNLLSYPAAWLSLKPQLASPVTAALVSKQCAALLQDFKWQPGVTRRVYQELTRTPGRFSSLEEIAEKLCMTSRTLRRKLEAEGTSYSALLSEVRRALALDFLASTELGIEDIANALGFSDAVSFRHAFKRWTGKWPRISRA